MESGIVALVNLKTDKTFFFFSKNINNDIVNMRFSLDLGLHKCINLQKDYSQIGLEVFRFDTVEITEDEQRLNFWKEKAKEEGKELY
ncbi:MAG: hypothetical protein HUK24_01095 [Sphaerochaetaceae bacterium]|nr:hypothetical protein [Sphaerochaetaceae bacterium]